VAISRNFRNVSATTTPAKLATSFDNMIDAVLNMLKKEGPIYSTWIRFQIGESNPLTFDTSSTSKKENLIAGLTFHKKGAGVVNDFELIIRYDPFDHGQNTEDKIELLDELIASAIGYDFDDDLKRLRGYIQYGYNVPDDVTLVSPKYEFILTNAESEVDWSTGLSEYKFEGTTELATDAEYTTSIPEFKDQNLLDIVEQVLQANYGINPEGKEKLVNGLKYRHNNMNYKIEIDDDLRKGAPTVSVAAVASQSPWIYCQNLLQSHMSVSDDALQYYKESDLSYLAPHYYMYVTDEADNKTIHISYIAPKDSGASNIALKHVFEWGKQSRYS